MISLFYSLTPRSQVTMNFDLSELVYSSLGTWKEGVFTLYCPASNVLGHPARAQSVNAALK